jgi:hypothetical protein
MQMQTQEKQSSDQGFNLDSYRNLLERLQASKRNQQQLAKKVPDSLQQQSV